MQKRDQSFEIPLRPSSLSEFIGQTSLLARLKILLEAASKRGDPLGHILLFGPPGLGKTTLAQILARSMGVNLVVSSGPVIEKAGDLAGILTSLSAGDILFIDEIHRLSKNIEEYLYPAMEDFKLDLMVDSGANARSVPIKIAPFTLLGATTKSGALSAPLRTRFLHQLRMQYYDHESLTQIVLRTFGLLRLDFDIGCAKQIAMRSRGTPRIANNLVRWVRDYQEIHGVDKSPLKATLEALKMIAIDEKGLDEIDKKILTVIMDYHAGGPVGLSTLAVAVGEEPATVAEVYEPFLILEGFLKRTARGREVTKFAYEHFNRPYPSK